MFKLMKGFKSYIGWILILILCTFLQVMCNLALPNLMSNIVDTGIVAMGGDIEYIAANGVKMLVIALVGSAAALSVGYIASKISVGFACDTRRRLFSHIQKFTMEEFDGLGTASLTARTTNDVMQVQDFCVTLFRFFVLAPIMCIGAIVMAVSKNPSLSWIIVVVMPIVVIVVVIISRKAVPLFKKVQAKLDNSNRIIREGLTGVRVIRAFSTEQREEARFDAANESLTKTSMKSQFTVATLLPVLLAVINFGIIAVVWIGSRFIDSGSMAVGDLMAFIQYLQQILMALILLSLGFVMFPKADACASRINEIMSIDPAVKDPAAIKEINEKTGRVEFKNVALAYGDGKNAIENITFTAEPGEVTAIIGGTGSGKSSVIKLIPRLYDATEGEVLVNGINVKDQKITSLREGIGYVPQKAVLFSGTIESNIKYSDESLDDARMEKAAQVAQSVDFIMTKKDKYKDHIGQGGSNVSGGQRQRLAIARALAKDSDILIFDDSFSALDFKTDKLLRRAIKEEYKDATVIIVAQRINTILDADKILVMDGGRIVGEGKHEQLLENCEVYADIVRSQTN